MTVLKIDGLIYSFAINKKGVTTLVIKTRKIFHSDIDRIWKGKKPVPVNIDIELPNSR
jgi:hypothetical protein